ncbi:MAG: hypothetical protein AAF653_14100, partial [Chloroflexota bacterium]
VDVNGEFVYNLDEYNAFIASIEDLTLLDISIDLLLEWLQVGVAAFDGELAIEVTPPAVFAFMLPVDTVDVNLWLVDGVGYVDLTPIGLLAEDETIAGIYGVDALQAVRDGLGMVTLGDVFAELEGDDMDGDFDFDDFDFGGDGFEQFQNQMEAQEAFEDEDVLNEFITFTRLDDSEVDGVAVAVFQTEVDFDALFASEAIVATLEANIPEEDLDGIELEMLISALQEGLAGSTLMSTDSYGIEDGILYASTLDMTIVVDPAPFEALDGGMEMDDMATEEAMEESDVVEVEVSIDLSRFSVNAVEEVTVPDDAVILTTEDLMQLGN